MNGRLYSMMVLLAASLISAAHLVHAQPATGRPPTLELGEVGTQPVEPIAAANATSNPAVRSSGSGMAPESRDGMAAPAPAKSAGTNSNPPPRKAKEALQRAVTDRSVNTKPERIEFKRHPLRIVLGTAERLVTFPNPVAISLPSGAETDVDMQIIGRTAYFTMLAQRSAPIRVLVDDLITGQTIPMDLLGMGTVDGLSSEVEVHYEDQLPANQQQVDRADEQSPALDMVQLTRYAAQTVYAPRRLKPSSDGVRSIPTDNKSIEGLFRGVRTRSRPIGQWRSGDLYVTAVQVVNLEGRSVSLDLEQIRGRWIAAALQHHRVLASGSDYDNTTLYLVCGQPFHSCR